MPSTSLLGSPRSVGTSPDQGVAMVGISGNDVVTYPQDGPDQMVAGARRHGWTFPYLHDETQDVARAYSAACTPDTFEITEMPARLARGLSVLHLRLAETRPIDLASAVEPLHAFIVELLTGVAKAGRLREDLGLHTQAALLQELLLASTHSRVLTGGSQTSVDDLWAFCSAAILRRED
jgi:hypothetical protein